eukprot:1145238-Pelagomonas_calceolata.AAC.1
MGQLVFNPSGSHDGSQKNEQQTIYKSIKNKGINSNTKLGSNSSHPNEAKKLSSQNPEPLLFRSTNRREGEAATARAHQPPTPQHQHHPLSAAGAAAGAAAPGQNTAIIQAS